MKKTEKTLVAAETVNNETIVIAQKQVEVREETKATPVPRNLVGAIADEVARTLIQRLPNMLTRKKKSTKGRSSFGRRKEAEGALFLDTSAIIDGRIFDVIELGLIKGFVVVQESILLELKHIADSQDTTKKERGRRGLEALSKVKKSKFIHLLSISDESLSKIKEVDERLIKLTKLYKGRLVTCDYNLEKKATVGGVTAINVHELANRLKVVAVPGEQVIIKVNHVGKDPTQGVGYLDDGTMVVVEKASSELEKLLNVTISRVIQTSSGRILFARKS